jgi:hypothetical protein
VNRFITKFALAMLFIPLSLQVAAGGYTISSYFGGSTATSIDASSPTATFDGVTYQYSVLGPITVSKSGYYEYSDIGFLFGISPSLDMELHIYDAPFNSADTSLNVVLNNVNNSSSDDRGSIVLDSANTYYFVVRPHYGSLEQVGRFIFRLSGPGDVAGLSASFAPAPIYDITLDGTGPKATFVASEGDTEYVVLGSFIYRDGMDVPASFDVGYQCYEYGCSDDLLLPDYDLDSRAYYYRNQFDADDAQEWEAVSDDSVPLKDGNEEDYTLVSGETYVVVIVKKYESWDPPMIGARSPLTASAAASLQPSVPVPSLPLLALGILSLFLGLIGFGRLRQ